MARAACLIPAVFPIKALQARCDHKRFARPQRHAHLGTDCSTVFGVQAVTEMEVPAKVIALVTQDAGHALREGMAFAHHVPVPHPAAAAIQGQTQLLFAFDQLLARSHTVLLRTHGAPHQPSRQAARGHHKNIVLCLLQRDVQRPVFYQQRHDEVARTKPQQASHQIQQQCT